MTRRRFLAHIAMLSMGANLAGCASLTPKDSDEELLTRAQAYWKARAAGDAITAWEYEAARVRKETTITAYAGRMGNFTFKEVQALRIEKGSEPNKANVKVRYVAQANIPGMSRTPMENEIDDPWELIDGQWYHAPKRNLPGNK